MTRSSRTAAPSASEDHLKYAQMHFENQNFEGMLDSVVASLDVDKAAVEILPAGRRFVYGSTRVEMRIDLEQNLFITESHVVNLPASRTLPLLRKLLELNHKLSAWSRFALEGDRVFLTFIDLLTHTHPEKIIGVTRWVMDITDQYDNLFVDDYGAAFADAALAAAQMRKNREDAERNVKALQGRVGDIQAHLSALKNDDAAMLLTLEGWFCSILVGWRPTPALMNRLHAVLENGMYSNDVKKSRQIAEQTMAELIGKTWTTDADHRERIAESRALACHGSFETFSRMLNDGIYHVDRIIRAGHFLAANYILSGTVFKILYLAAPPPDIGTRLYEALDLLESDGSEMEISKAFLACLTRMRDTGPPGGQG